MINYPAFIKKTRNNKLFPILLYTFLILTFCSLTPSEKSVIKVACVGDSITFGYSIHNRNQNSYPRQLQRLLGERYEVKNFGISGRTLVKKGDLPYWKEETYKSALAYKADVLFIMLGTNDSKYINRGHLENFYRDYKKFIGSFQKANPKARIVLLQPPPSFLQDTMSIWNPIIKKRIVPKIHKLAYDLDLETIDINQLMVDNPSLFPDKVHPNIFGAKIIARRLYEVVIQDSTSSTNFNVESSFSKKSQENFYGYKQYNFQMNGHSVKIVEPKRPAPSHPWLWRARFFGHEPQTDIALLERGFYLVYCDVANLYGNIEAVERWDAFYKLMIAKGFSKKVALEGMSRGGLIIYNWATKNPEKVACIYADAPALDSKSWPKGEGDGKGSSSNWKSFIKAYQLKTKLQIKNFKGNPIDHTKEIAKGGYPMLHVCGLTDDVVPVEENTQPFVKAVRKYGGDIQTIYKKNNGHHPHSLKSPVDIVNFILNATNQKISFATLPMPSEEYRSESAGWTKNSTWHTQAKDIDTLCQEGNIDILFLGNSITQGLGIHRANLKYIPAREALSKYLSNYKTVCGGIAGDRTSNLLWRIINSHYEKSNPKYVTIAIGVNNFIDHDTAEDIADGIKAVLKTAREKFGTKTHFLLFGLLPTGITKDSPRRYKYNKVQKLIAHLGQLNNVEYCNMNSMYINKGGNLCDKCYGDDGIHLTAFGYDLWLQYISKHLKNKSFTR